MSRPAVDCGRWLHAFVGSSDTPDVCLKCGARNPDPAPPPYQDVDLDERLFDDVPTWADDHPNDDLEAVPPHQFDISDVIPGWQAD